MNRRLLSSVAAASLVAVVALAASRRAPVAVARGPIAVIDHLASPEALTFDPALDVYFVSNVNGNPGIKHGNGFIARVTADGRVDSLHFIQGGRNGVALDAPTGSRVRGDTLWVLDVDKLRAFDTRSGTPLMSIDLSALAPLFLNDLAIGPDGDIYITDTGFRADRDEHTGPDRIYRVGRDRKPVIALETPTLTQPDGIDWDPAARRFILAPIGGMAVQSWRPRESRPTSVVSGKGRFDGIEIERDGRIFITSWADSSVLLLDGARLVRLLGPLSVPPSDVSLDAKHHRVAIVSLANDRFELWADPVQP